MLSSLSSLSSLLLLMLLMLLLLLLSMPSLPSLPMALSLKLTWKLTLPPPLPPLPPLPSPLPPRRRPTHLRTPLLCCSPRNDAVRGFLGRVELQPFRGTLQGRFQVHVTLDGPTWDQSQVIEEGIYWSRCVGL